MRYLNGVTALLAILKLLGVLHIGWLLVFIPTFIYLGFALIGLIIVAVLMTVVGMSFKEVKDKYTNEN